MPVLEKIFYMFIFNFCAFVLLLVVYINYQNDIIASVRAIGVQCNAEFSIELPDPAIEGPEKDSK